MRFTRTASVVVTLGILLAACAPASQPAALTVFAAASLTEAFTDIGAQFEAAHQGVDVVFNFGGSNQLAQQLGQGAPADVFASANPAQMQVAIEAGRVISGAQQIFVRNRLVVISPKHNPDGVTTLADLARPGLKLILAAAEVPVGQYALDFLDRAAQDPAFGAEYKESVLDNVVSYEENVRSVFAKVSLGEADAGIVYTSDIAGAGSEAVERLDIPDALNTIAAYPIAVVSDSANAALARAFVDRVLSPEGQAVMETYGFVRVN